MRLGKVCISVASLALGLSASARAAVQFYGDENVLNSGATYPSDPTAGATLEGLAPGVVTAATLIQGHGFPFSPEAGDFPGTDQIYVGSVQTAFRDGYSASPTRINGPDNLSLDYSALVPSGQTLTSFTLGIAYDDFQPAGLGDPFFVTVNGANYAPLTALTNSLNEGGPVVQFYTIGLDPSLLSPTNVLNLSIDEGGDGGDGYAIDYLTAGVTTSAVPEPASLSLLGIGSLAVLARRRAKRT